VKKQQAPIAGRYRVLDRRREEEHGLDMRGNPVLVRPPAGSQDGIAFVEQEELERTLRVLASIESPWLLPVLCSTPRVVYAAPPPATRPAALSPSDAATCLVELCDVLARLHAAGWTGLRTDAYNLRVSRQDAVWRLTRRL
jgi:hypothetical protein